MLDLNELVNKIKNFVKSINIEAFKRKEKYKLVEESPKFIILESPKIISKNNNLNIERIREEYRKILEEFIEVMKKNIPEELLTTMYNNLSTLDVIDTTQLKIIGLIIEKTMGDVDYAGMYNPLLNRIKLNTKYVAKAYDSYYYKGVLFHELLHMSSRTKDKNGIYCGFNHLYRDVRFIGININEGYTETLIDRILPEEAFNPENPYDENSFYSSSYEYIIYRAVAKITENIIGKEKMTSLYFHSDLKGLVEELAKYSTEEDAIIFIQNLDNNKIEDCLKYIHTIYITKLANDLKSNIITKKEAIYQLGEHIHCIGGIISGLKGLEKKEESEKIRKYFDETNNIIMSLWEEEPTIGNNHKRL